MATRKSMWVLFGILLICAWLLGSVTQGVAEQTMKCKIASTNTKDERISLNDEEGHGFGMSISEGLAFFEGGEIAKTKSYTLFDFIPGKRSQQIGYTFFTFEDGATIVTSFQRLIAPGQSGIGSGKGAGEITKGTGRFEGIKGTTSSTAKLFPANKGEPSRNAVDFTFTYTLPTK
jgi:hypothetical protein